MKKTLLALAVAAMAASAANATVIYQKDGTKIDLDGRVALEIRNEKGKRSDLVDAGGSRVRVRAFQDIGGGFEALGAVELRFSQAGEVGNSARAHRLFAGFQHKDIGSLTFGRQLVLGDHIPKANYTYEMGGNVFLDAHGKAAHFMSKSFNGFRVAADYYFGSPEKSSTAGKLTDAGQGFQLGAFYDRKAGDFAVRIGAGYGEIKELPFFDADGKRQTQPISTLDKDSYKTKIAGVGFDVTYGIVSFGVDWAYAKSKAGQGTRGFQIVGGAFDQVSRFEVGTKVAVTKQNNIYGEILFGNAKNLATATLRDQKFKTFGWILGADHKFNKNVSIYVEGGKASAKSEGSTVAKNHRISVGTRILF